jgi:NADPH:quinone reductase-like Zn-dependent oxidoreductase
MRAAVTAAAGGPIGVTTVDDPVAGEGETLVEVHAASVNRLDRAVFEGVGIGRFARFPLIQGIDAAGVALSGALQGHRVVVKPSAPCGECRFCDLDRDADCTSSTVMGIHRSGGFAESVVVPSHTVFAVPESLSFEEAAAAAHVHPVTLRMIRTAGVAEGETVLVTGAAGAVGLAAVQLSTALGARAIGVCSTEAKAEAVRAQRGTAVVVGAGDLEAEIRELTDGAGVDVVLDSTGHPEVAAVAAATMGRGGRFVVVGTHVGSRLEIDLSRLYTMRQRFLGSAGSGLADFGDAFELMDRAGIRPVVGAAHGLDEVEAALGELGDRSRIGKPIIRIR